MNNKEIRAARCNHHFNLVKLRETLLEPPKLHLVFEIMDTTLAKVLENLRIKKKIMSER